MLKPKLCVVLTNNNLKNIRIANSADLIEIRMDIIGSSWVNLPRKLEKPWIACNRLKSEGGLWKGTERERVKELLRAASLGATYIDIELNSLNIREIVKFIKKSNKKVLISLHDIRRTPPLRRLTEIVNEQIGLGADLCKVVVTAEKFEDNLTILKLLDKFVNVTQITAFCMGEKGNISRVLSPLFGGSYMYVSTAKGLESASGQIELNSFNIFYKMLQSKLEKFADCDKL
jgi:3-dehydroquinate dehydratase type I